MNSVFVSAKVFPISTEMQIGRIKNLVDRAPKGIYLTVGGERAFRGASMFEAIDHLVIFDISPDIIRFNAINRELLKAPNKEDYKHLRWEGTLLEWQKTSNMLTEDDFKWWVEFVRDNKEGYDLPEKLNRYGTANRFIKVRQKLMSFFPKVSKKFNAYDKVFLTHVTWADIENLRENGADSLTKEEFEWFEKEKNLPNSCVQQLIDNPAQAMDWGQIIDYKSGNYLFDDKLYQRLHMLASDQKITVIQTDLAKAADIDLLAATIKKLQSNLAIVDLDNLYRYGYMGEEKFRTALSRFLDLGTKDSIIILMSNYKDYPCGVQFQIYVGFTFENVRHWPDGPFFESFINSLPSDVLPLLDGRLYEGNDELPFYLMGQSKSAG
jgi:hypothetical protein